MKFFKRILIALIVLLLLAGVAAAVLYMLAIAVPGEYRPRVLSREERKQAAKRFYATVQEFINKAEHIEPFEMTITQRELNEYLASVQEIVDEVPGPSEGSAYLAMEKAGLASPMVLLAGGRLTLMALSTEYNGVVSIDVEFELTDQRLLRCRISDVRIGKLSAPDFVVGRSITRIKERLGRPRTDSEPERQAAGLFESADEVGRLVRTVISALDEEPISPVFGHRKRKKVRLTRLEIESGSMVLGFEPYGRGPMGDR